MNMTHLERSSPRRGDVDPLQRRRIVCLHQRAMQVVFNPQRERVRARVRWPMLRRERRVAAAKAGLHGMGRIRRRSSVRGG